jgi:pancreatic triacylglycerol lipase
LPFPHKSFVSFRHQRVDWSRGAQTINYITARNRVDPTGRVLAEFIDFLHDSGGLRFEELTVAGFSLGGELSGADGTRKPQIHFPAHIAGIAGKAVRYGRINTIIGLDPAGPLFSLRDVHGRLDRRDADYVEVIHTNSRVTGIGFPIGHADFFPNGGSQQPGCLRNFCNHDRAPKFFTESITNNNFFARRCESIADVVEGGCSGTPLATMGGEPSNANNNVRGVFHLRTNRSSPFAQGKPPALPLSETSPPPVPRD